MPLSTLEALLEGVLDAVILSDDHGVIHYVNATTERLFGWLRAELVGQPIEVLVPQPSRTAHVGIRTQHLATSNRPPMLRRVVSAQRRDGSLFDLQISIGQTQIGAKAWVISIARDVTQERTREHEAWDQIKRLQLLNRVNQAGVHCEDLASLARAVMFEIEANELAFYASLCVVTPDRKYLQVLARSKRVADETPASRAVAIPGRLEQDLYALDAMGANAVLLGDEVLYTDLAHSELPTHRAIAQLGLGSGMLIPCEPANRVQTVLLVARPEVGELPSVDREFFRALAYQFWVAADHIRLAEAQRRVDETVAAQWQSHAHHERLAVLGSMAAGVVHDIHNAITPVLCLAELELSAADSLDPKMREVLEQMHVSARDVVQVATRMRSLVKHGDASAQRFPVQLNEIVAQVVQMSRARWRDAAQARGLAIRVRQDVDAALPFFSAGESELREAILNLTLNAIDAMPQGGDLTLRTRQTARDGRPFAIVEVVDTGVGMDAETLRRCIEPYFTTKGDRGTGLGLVSVNVTAAQHGGRLHIRSVPGQGTTMALELPIVHDPPREMAPKHVTENRALRVLVIDDEPLVLRVLRRMLEHLGHTVEVADSAESGLQRLAEAPADQPHDIVLTDLGMPFMNGCDLARLVRQRWPHLPVVLITGWLDRADIESDRLFAAHLAKPPSVDTLRGALAEALEWQAP